MLKSILWVFAFLLCVMTLSARMSSAQSVNSPTISYQGVLKGIAGGNETPCTKTFIVSLYADPAGDSLIWRDIFTTEIDSGDVFNVELGSGVPLPNPKTMDRPMWLGVSINYATEMRPLSRFSAVP